jgi:hypothetical protein
MFLIGFDLDFFFPVPFNDTGQRRGISGGGSIGGGGSSIGPIGLRHNWARSSTDARVAADVHTSFPLLHGPVHVKEEYVQGK